MLSVSAGFRTKLDSQSPSVVRTFEYKRVDTSEDVKSWGNIIRQGDKIVSGNLGTPLNNSDGSWNVIRTTPASHLNEGIGKIKLSFSDYIADTGTATSGGANTLTDTSKTWTVNIYTDYYVKITAGTGLNQIRQISSNTATQLTVYNNWDAGGIPDATSQYQIFEAIQIFHGTLDNARYNEDDITLTFRDKFTYLNQLNIGSRASPADYYTASGISVTDWVGGSDGDWSSGKNPAKMAWSFLTYWGKLSSIESTANPDIDWTSFTLWRYAMRDCGYVLQGYIEGLSIPSMLQKLCDLTHSAIFTEGDGKIYFQVWIGQDTASLYTYTDAKMEGIPEIELDRTDLVNKYVVYYDYDPIAQTWAGFQTQEDSTSQTEYGLFLETLDDTSIWHATSTSANDFAIRQLDKSKDPAQVCEFETYLMGFPQQVYDGIKLTETFHSLTDQGMRVEKVSYKIDTSTVRLTGTLQDLFHFLVLDHDDYGLLDSDNGLL